MAGPHIREQKVGDKQIDTQNFNRIAAGADRAQRMKFDQKYFQQVSTGGFDLITLRSESFNFGDPPFQFQVEIREGGNKIGIRCGVVQREETEVLAPSTTAAPTSRSLNEFFDEDVTGFADGKHHVVRQLKEDLATDPQPWLIPQKIEYAFPTDAAVGAFRGVNDPFNQNTVLAEFEILNNHVVEVIQHDRRGDKDDRSVVPDAEGTLWSTAKLRSTMEFNPETTEHEHELQWYNVDTVLAQSDSLAFFASDAEEAGIAVGAADYAAPDRNLNRLTPVNASLEIKDTPAPTGKMQIFGFDSADNFTAAYHTSTAPVTASARSIAWQVPVKEVGTLVTANFSTGWLVDINISTGLGNKAASGVLFTEFDNIDVQFGALRIDALPAGAGIDFTMDVDVPLLLLKHFELDFSPTTSGVAGNNADHDKQYAVQGDVFSSTFYAQSIGFGTSLTRTSGLPLPVEVMTLSSDGGNLVHGGSNAQVLAWDSARELKGGVVGGSDHWGVAANTRFDIDNLTIGSLSGGSALDVFGGMNARKMSVFGAPGGTKFAVLDDDGTFGPNGGAGFFRDLAINVELAVTGSHAAQLENATDFVTILDGTHGIDSDLKINIGTGDGLEVNGARVVSDRGASIGDITVTGAARDGDVRAVVNAILARMRLTGGHGLIAD